MKLGGMLLLVLLSNQGHWFGGEWGRVRIDWRAAAAMPEAVVSWSLMYGETALASGGLKLRPDDDDGPSILRLRVPEVRARTRLRLVYRVRDPATGLRLAGGEARILVYPRGRLGELGEQLARRRLVIWAEADGLASALEKAGVESRRVSTVTELRFAEAELLLVGADQLKGQPGARGVLLGHVRRGAGVLVLQQRGAERPLGYPTVLRPAPAAWWWREGHPLSAALRRWAPMPRGKLVPAIRLAEHAPMRTLVAWPDAAPEQPVSRKQRNQHRSRRSKQHTDALVAVRHFGKGAVMLCQVPLGNWETDPRSRGSLAAMLEHLVGASEIAAGAPSTRPFE